MATWKKTNGKWINDAGVVADQEKAKSLEEKAGGKKESPSWFNDPQGVLRQSLSGFNDPIAAALDVVTKPFHDGSYFRDRLTTPKPKTTSGRIARAGGRGAFDAMAFLAPQFRAAQLGALAEPVTANTGTFARIGKNILDTTRAAPGPVAATEVVANTAAGVGSQTATEAFPDSKIAPAIGALAGAAIPAVAGGRAMRGLIEPPKIRPDRPKITESVIKPGEIKKSAAGLPENISPEVVNPERLSVAAQREVANAAGDLLEAGGVPRDPNLKLYEQVADLLSTGRISPANVEKIITARGITKEEFATGLYGKNVSQAARELQVLSSLQQRLKASAGGDIEIVGDNRTFIQKLDDIRRGALVSQVGTAVRNATVGVYRGVFDTFNRALDYGIASMRGKVNPNNPVNSPAQVFGGLMRMLKPKESIDVLKQVLEIRPKQYDQLMRQYSADLALGGTGPLKKVERGVYFVNVWNRLQDQYFRSAIFADSLERRLAAQGMDMGEMLKSGQQGAMPKEVVDGAVKDALEFTFSDEVKTQSGKAFVDFIEKWRPLTTITMPFPRFFANSIRFMTEASPLGPLWLLSKAERQALIAGDNRIITRALLGTAATVTGYAIRDSKFAGEKWYEVKSPDGKRTIDMRPYYPVAAYLFTGDLVNRFNKGTLFNMTAKDIAQGITGAQVRGGTGLYMVDGFINDVTGDANAGKKAWQIFKRLSGEYAAGYLLPFQQVKDVYSQFDEEDRIIRDVGDNPFIGPMLTKLPGASKSLPAAESATQAANIERQDPLLRQLTGINLNQEKNPAQREIDRLGIPSYEVYRTTGDPIADRLLKKHMGPMVEEFVGRLVQTPLYTSLGNLKNNGGPPAQRYFLGNVFGYIREVARIKATQEAPLIMARVKYNSGVDKDLRIMIDRMYGINAESIGAQ